MALLIKELVLKKLAVSMLTLIAAKTMVKFSFEPSMASLRLTVDACSKAAFWDEQKVFAGGGESLLWSFVCLPTANSKALMRLFW